MTFFFHFFFSFIQALFLHRAKQKYTPSTHVCMVQGRSIIPTYIDTLHVHNTILSLSLIHFFSRSTRTTFSLYGVTVLIKLNCFLFVIFLCIFFVAGQYGFQRNFHFHCTLSILFITRINGCKCFNCFFILMLLLQSCQQRFNTFRLFT